MHIQTLLCLIVIGNAHESSLCDARGTRIPNLPSTLWIHAIAATADRRAENGIEVHATGVTDRLDHRTDYVHYKTAPATVRNTNNWVPISADRVQSDHRTVCTESDETESRSRSNKGINSGVTSRRGNVANRVAVHGLDEGQATGSAEFALQRSSIGRHRARLITNMIAHVAARERTGTEPVLGCAQDISRSVVESIECPSPTESP